MHVESGSMASSLLKRLDLRSSSSKFDDMLQGIDDVANLPEPANQTTYAMQLDEGLELYRVTCELIFSCTASTRCRLNGNFPAAA